MNSIPGYDAWKLATPPEHEGDEDERDDSPYCDCGAIPDQEEQDANRCNCCGKRIDP